MAAQPGAELEVLTIARTLPRHIRGGMEEVTWKLAKALQAQGARQTVVTSSFDHETRVVEEDGITIHEVAYVPERLRDKPHYRWWPHFGRAAGAYARAEGLTPDVVHCQSFYADGVLRWPDPPPVVLTVHGTAYHRDYLGGSRDKLIREVGRWHPRRALQRVAVLHRTLQENWQMRRADAVVPVSAAAARTLTVMDAGDPRMRIIPNGVEPGEFPEVSREAARAKLGLDADATVLFYLGRVEEGKGVDHLVDAVGRDPGRTLLVAGSGPHADALRARVDREGLAGRVRLLGRVPDDARPALYAAADLFCLASKAEALPVTLLESMAMGTPVAITDDWLPPGLLPFAAVDPDPHEAIAQGLELARRLDPARVRAALLADYTWDAIARTYLDLFRGLAGAGHGGE